MKFYKNVNKYFKKTKYIIILFCLNFSFLFSQQVEFFETSSLNEKQFKVLLDHKWGVADSLKNIIIPPKYEYIYAKSENLYMFQYNKKIGFVNEKGFEVIKAVYDTIQNKHGNCFAIEKYNDSNTTNYVLIGINNNRGFNEGNCVVSINSKYGFINSKGQVVIPLMYEYADDFNNNLAIVKLNSKFGLINKKGKIVLKNLYDKLYWKCYHNTENFLTEFDMVLYAELHGEKYFIEIDGTILEKLEQPIR
jgi:hypothetical protein